MPQFPAGVPVVVVPLQSATPLFDGSWPGGKLSLDATLQTMDAELAFAYAESRAGGMWATPPMVIEQAARNPIVRVDPQRLAYQGLISRPPMERQIYEPLHGQLRTLAALFDARFVLLPLRLGFEPMTADEQVPASEAVITEELVTADDPVSAEEEGVADGEVAADEPLPSPAPVAAADEPQVGRAVLLFAMIDIRRSAVMWHGQIWGEPADRHSAELLATLAARVANLTAPQ